MENISLLPLYLYVHVHVLIRYTTTITKSGHYYHTKTILIHTCTKTILIHV